MAAFREHLYPAYAPPALRFDSGEGAWLTSDTGARYLDFIGGISVLALGHAHPALVKALNEQASKLWHLSNMFDIPGQADLARRYCEETFADRVFFTNSGAEAVECAIKTARRYHFDAGAPERTSIIGFDGAFHGRTYAAMNAAGNPAYLKGFGPALPGFVHLPFGDHEVLKQAVDETTAAIIVEPVQGEGGLRPLPDACLRGLRELCDASGALLIYDEVQCGAGRTGKLFAHQWVDGSAPDLMAAAKGIGGGFPLGMCLATAKVGDCMTVGTHGSTYGGNALAMAVGHAALTEMQKPDFMPHVDAMGARLRAGLDRLVATKNSVVEVRGKGLLTGIKVAIPNTDIRKAALDVGLLVGTAGDNTVRLAPPLIINEGEVDEALDRLEQAIEAA